MGLWTIGSRLLKLARTSYFDGFLSMSTTGLAKHTDLCIPTFFHLLGWDLSTDKLVPYAECCKVLGAELVLTKTPSGSFDVRNTQSRIDELTHTHTMMSVLQTGYLSRTDGEKLRGRLQFASDQLFGRRFRNCLQEPNVHIAHNLRAVSPSLSAALKLMVHLLNQNSPRTVSTVHTDWFHLYVDAAFEPEGFSGIGGLLLDSQGMCIGCFSEVVGPYLLATIMRPDQKTSIMELEALAIYVALDLFKDLIRGTRLVVFHGQPKRASVSSEVQIQQPAC